MSGPAGSRGGEQGSITVVSAGIIAIVVIATMGVADVGKALTARDHAQAAADAAALAAAQELAVGTGNPPAAMAAAFARRNGATLISCACDLGGTDAVVRVSMPVGHLLLLAGDRSVVAIARAVVDLAAPGP